MRTNFPPSHTNSNLRTIIPFSRRFKRTFPVTVSTTINIGMLSRHRWKTEGGGSCRGFTTTFMISRLPCCNSSRMKQEPREANHEPSHLCRAQLPMSQMRYPTDGDRPWTTTSRNFYPCHHISHAASLLNSSLRLVRETLKSIRP